MGRRIRCPRLQAGVENQATNGEPGLTAWGLLLCTGSSYRLRCLLANLGACNQDGAAADDA
jgi:hypothetical protein